ncbi:MAG: AI-2E family transporter [Deltaproteobacteria bacterium]|nr:AI-2E family transporter [Deltaproteobacteria bacterium]
MIPPSSPRNPSALASGPATSRRDRDRWGRRLTIVREQIFAGFFFAVFLFLLYQLYRVLSGFLGPIVWAAILTLVFYPLYQRVLRAVRGNATLAALALTTLVTVTLVVPTASLSTVVTQESVGLYQQLTEWVRSGSLNERVQELRASSVGRVAQRLSRQGWEVDWGSIVQRTADTVSTHVTALARNVAVFFFDFTIMLFTLFFFFRDGDRMFTALRNLIPMDPVHKDAVFRRLYETISAVMRGMVVTAIVQGLLTWIGLALVGVPYAAFLGVAAGLMALVPLIGAAGVWIPCAVYLAATGLALRAVILVAYGTLVISMVDNILRPLLIGGRTRLPTIFLFFGMLGGIEAYGVLGIFLGPVLLSIVVSFIQIYQSQYATPDPTLPALPAA